MIDCFETYFDAFCAYFATETVLGFVIMSTRENIRLIARAPLELMFLFFKNTVK